MTVTDEARRATTRAGMAVTNLIEAYGRKQKKLDEIEKLAQGWANGKDAGLADAGLAVLHILRVKEDPLTFVDLDEMFDRPSA